MYPVNLADHRCQIVLLLSESSQSKTISWNWKGHGDGIQTPGIDSA